MLDTVDEAHAGDEFRQVRKAFQSAEALLSAGGELEHQRPASSHSDTQPVVRSLRWRIVANADSIGLVVRKCTQ